MKMENTKSKKEYIESWKSELDNLRNIFCNQRLKKDLNRYIYQIETVIEEIADSKNLPEE